MKIALPGETYFLAGSGKSAKEALNLTQSRKERQEGLYRDLCDFASLRETFSGG
jgi:hypothetical protein